MPFDFLHISLIVSASLLLIAVLILAYRVRKGEGSVKRKLGKTIEKIQKDKLYLEKEIKRQNYLLSELKKGNGIHKNVPVAVSSQAIEQTAGQSLDSGVVETYNSQSSEDYEFKEKNKKLWELSIAVHKEKERINSLRKEIEHRHEEVTKSITYAQRIQKALLPTSKFLGVRFSDYFILLKPRDIVSGDFYWFKRLENTTVIVAADCTGHGVPGAFMSLLGISFLNDIYTKTTDLKSYQLLDRLREMVKLALQQEFSKKRRSGDGIDMGICIINHKTMEADFAGANNPLYLLRNDEIIVFKENRNPVGIHPFEKPFVNHEFKLQKDDRIYMFSDGYIDQFGGAKGRKFLKKNFQRLLLQLASENISMLEERQVLDETLLQWRGEKHPQIDDVLIIGVKI